MAWGANDGWKDPESYEIEYRINAKAHSEDKKKAEKKSYNDGLKDAAKLVRDRSPGSLGHESLANAILALQR